MKKLNKKGFTLAELLIVIAIIAILIAIAIPVFGAQLDNARIQTDHANIRNAYALMQVANIEGKIEIGNSGTLTPITDTSAKTLVYQKDGSVAATGDGDYVCLATGDTDKCASSAGCQVGASGAHKKDDKITLTYNATEGKYEMSIAH